MTSRLNLVHADDRVECEKTVSVNHCRGWFLGTAKAKKKLAEVLTEGDPIFDREGMERVGGGGSSRISIFDIDFDADSDFDTRMESIQDYHADKLTAKVYPDRETMGRAAAEYAAELLNGILAEQGEARIVVGSAPSQDEFYRYLSEADVDWSKVEVFHMDEYIGLAADHPQSFRKYQMEHFVGKVGLKAFHPIRGEAEDPRAECDRLHALLAEKPIDLVCLGIGENGHLAFNDPPVADFEDPVYAKIVELDDICRQQQVNDGCFPDFDSVPARAITLTLRVFREARHLSGVVPAPTKAEAVKATLFGGIGTACPATLMRQHPSARLHLEPESASLL